MDHLITFDLDSSMIIRVQCMLKPTTNHGPARFRTREFEDAGLTSQTERLPRTAHTKMGTEPTKYTFN